MNRSTKIRLLILLTLVVVAGVMSWGTIPQAEAYHLFCDQRVVLGIPHFGDVVSNLAFLLVGSIGLFRVWHSNVSRGLKSIYFAVFAGIFLTGVGSAIYHYHPADGSLVYDRLPMTLVFMGMTAAVIEEGVGGGSGVVALWPLLAAGVGSVLWWQYTGQRGGGDLRFYVLVQYYPLLFIPVVLLLFPGERVRRGWRPLLFCFACYALAKVVESLDCSIYSLTGWISGHTVKHLLSVLAVYFLVVRFCVMYEARPGRV